MYVFYMSIKNLLLSVITNYSRYNYISAKSVPYHWPKPQSPYPPQDDQCRAVPASTVCSMCTPSSAATQGLHATKHLIDNPGRVSKATIKYKTYLKCCREKKKVSYLVSGSHSSHRCPCPGCLPTRTCIGDPVPRHSCSSLQAPTRTHK
jgi:hypothetical protein